ncbi:hypothetical protein [Coleofasciculus sp.]|uniref:hypothetical protein n=1 Tax=Coleofasciculus sp. TaxID=3100458 RepID=UPI0040649A7F
MTEDNKLLKNICTFKDYLISSDRVPLFLLGDTHTLLKLFPADCILPVSTHDDIADDS